MDAYRRSRDPRVFAQLFELNRGALLRTIEARLRRQAMRVDAQDVLQEVFLNIFRYPHRFQADRADAFRSWSYRIVLNTLLKTLKSESRIARLAALDDEGSLPEDPRAHSPERLTSESERAAIVNHAWFLFLNLYLTHYQRLSARERRALTLVEVEGATYREAAAHLCIRIENLKMVVLRARRKIFRRMLRSVGELGAATTGSTRPSIAGRDDDPATQSPRELRPAFAAPTRMESRS